MMPSPQAPHGPSRGRPRSFDRDQALDQAMKVFWVKGFAGSSLSDLTSAMNIASPSLYAAFGSKEGLFQEALDHYERTYGCLAQAIFDGPGLIQDQIEQVLMLLVRDGAGAVPMGCMVVSACAQATDLSPELAAALCEKRISGARLMETRIRRAVVEGELSAAIDPRAIADFYATIQRGLSVSAKSGASVQEMTSVVASAMAAWAPLTASRPSP